MNKIVNLSGDIYSDKNLSSGGGPHITPGDNLCSEKAKDLKRQIKNSIDDWKSLNAICDPIISIRYTRIIPKSLRMGYLFKKYWVPVNKTIIGASYNSDNTKHIIVYRLSIDVLEDAIKKLETLISILDEKFNGKISSDDMKVLFYSLNYLNEEQKRRRHIISEWVIRKFKSLSEFGQLVQDVYFIDAVYIDKVSINKNESMYVSFYDIGLDEEELFSKLGLFPGIDKIGNNKDGYAYLLTPDQIKSVSSRYPYLISMCGLDMNTIPPCVFGNSIRENIEISDPFDEPVIGVLDGCFDSSVYFSKWVEYHNIGESRNKLHGTAVASLLVDGPTLNPDLEDGCGRFRVRLFSVMDDNEYLSQFDFYSRIESIVKKNTDIKVWNISLGAKQEIDKYSISPVAALLDQLQIENDIIFVVCGTNNNSKNIQYPYVGSPADSVNSIVVNSVNKDGSIPDYARRGPVLGFYQCPDLCAVGGDSANPLYAYSSNGLSQVHGTSFATCWVARKLAYLIYKLNFSREAAKALLIDAAYGWNSITDGDKRFLLGCGILPKRIEDVINTQESEIKVILKGNCELYKTYSYRIPVPCVEKKFPFFAKATLCYFPKCSRKQGVDYTITELDLHFGRMDNNGKVKSINNNRQGDNLILNLPEEIAKKEFRKWDSVKHICEEIRPNAKFRNVLTDSSDKPFGFWGFYVLKKARTEASDEKINFALILTFKSIDGKNRFTEFVQYARANGWIATELDAKVMTEVYDKGQVEIDFTE